MRVVAGPFFKSQLHICTCPLTITLIGFPIMAFAFARYKKPSMFIGIGLIAASFSWLAVPFYNIPLFTTPLTTYPLVNPTIAIIITSLVFASIAHLSQQRIPMTVASSVILATEFVIGSGEVLIATRVVAFVRWESMATVPPKRLSDV